MGVGGFDLRLAPYALPVSDMQRSASSGLTTLVTRRPSKGSWTLEAELSHIRLVEAPIRSTFKLGLGLKVSFQLVGTKAEAILGPC